MTTASASFLRSTSLWSVKCGTPSCSPISLARFALMSTTAVSSHSGIWGSVLQWLEPMPPTPTTAIFTLSALMTMFL